MANHFNHSSKIQLLFDEVRRQDNDEKIQALDKIIELVDYYTPFNPCLRCRNAEWILAWDDGRKHWDKPNLMACRACVFQPIVDGISS